MKFGKPIQLFCLVLFAVFTVNGQESSETKVQKPIIGETVTRESWNQPIFVKPPSKVSTKKILTIQGTKVLTRFHRFEKRQFFSMVESCEIDQDALEASYNDFDYLLDGFTSYEVKGKVFAYGANFWFVRAEDGFEIGAGVLPIYVDEEGTGHFKLLCNGETDLESLPDWVKIL